MTQSECASSLFRVCMILYVHAKKICPHVCLFAAVENWTQLQELEDAVVKPSKLSTTGAGPGTQLAVEHAFRCDNRGYPRSETCVYHAEFVFRADSCCSDGAIHTVLFM